MQFSRSIIIIFLGLALSMPWSSFALDKDAVLQASVCFLRENIKKELDADKINFETFKTILNHHQSVSLFYVFAKRCEPRASDTFIDEGSYHWTNPDFCDYTCGGSFAGRFAATCCGENNSDKGCCL